MILKDFLDQNQDLIAGTDVIKFQKGFHSSLLSIINLQIYPTDIQILDDESNWTTFLLSTKIVIENNSIILKDTKEIICYISFFSLRPVKLRENVT